MKPNPIIRLFVLLLAPWLGVDPSFATAVSQQGFSTVRSINQSLAFLLQTQALTLPLASQEAAVPGGGAHSYVSRTVTHEAAPIAKRLIFLVEDTPSEQQTYRQELEENGYEVVLCPDGETALDYLHSRRASNSQLPDAILTDRHLGHGKMRGQSLVWQSHSLSPAQAMQRTQ